MEIETELNSSLDCLYLFSFSKREITEMGLDPVLCSGRVLEVSEALFRMHKEMRYGYHAMEVKRNGMGKSIWKARLFFFSTLGECLNHIKNESPHLFRDMDHDDITNNAFIHVNSNNYDQTY